MGRKYNLSSLNKKSSEKPVPLQILQALYRLLPRTIPSGGGKKSVSEVKINVK